ncbi:MAG: leucyl aminopeptidase [Pikeienuella sp.]
MTHPAEITFVSSQEITLADATGAVCVFALGDGTLSAGAAAADALTGGAVARIVAAKTFKGEAGQVVKLPAPGGMAADALYIAALGDDPDAEAARKAGAALGKAIGKGTATIVGAGDAAAQAEIAFGYVLRSYNFDVYKTASEDDEAPEADVVFASDEAEAVAQLSAPLAALAEGVYFTRDLVNEPANVLTTEDFAARLAAMGELGLEVDILGEAEMRELGMNALLAVGMASDDECKLVVMKWNGGGDEAPLAVVGKGVVFDTGGISLKPAGGMEDMTMDMGGAGVVSGLMRTLALRKAKANVVGVVGIVENMPAGNAQRPGDIVKSMKGDTIEVINTDAEGRLVLCDALWYTQERFKPSGVIDLATLTGAVIIALGHENTGVFSNDDAFCDAFLDAAKTSGEGAWRLPLGAGYDKQIKSRLADMKNVGGRPAGSITAAQFLQRFIKDGVPWIHLDIAGTASLKSATDLAPAGATGWGVRALNQLIADKYEN